MVVLDSSTCSSLVIFQKCHAIDPINLIPSPKHKFIRITKDDSFSADLHYLSNTPAKAEAACAYDLDQCDEAWLGIVNGERAMTGAGPVSEEQFERVIEELEVS